MYVIIDFLEVHQIGHRENRNRFYYTVEGYPNLLLVSQIGAFEKIQGKKVVLLWNDDQIDSSIVCDCFPDAPSFWREEKLIQASLTNIPGKGQAVPLSQELERRLDSNLRPCNCGSGVSWVRCSSESPYCG